VGLPDPLADRFGRRIDYLRISLTERCDLHCAYCRPQPEAPPSRRDELAPDDVAHVAEAAVRLGVRRIRLTGGEPLLRRDLAEVVSALRSVSGLDDLAMTTNGQSLAGRASELAGAGLMRVNISLDSLDPQVYGAITGGGSLSAVRRGIDAALEAGLSPVKVNVVLHSQAAVGRAALAPFTELTKRPVHVRFIEAMPICSSADYVPAQQVLEVLAGLGELTPVSGPPGGGPARYYQLDGSSGSLGIITPISEPFCDRCNRLRVTARGTVMPCLFSMEGMSLLPALSSDCAADEVAGLLLEAAAAKPRRYGDIAESSTIRAMHVIGG
jgi:cyclic pyranopterin phosphate synthase